MEPTEPSARQGIFAAHRAAAIEVFGADSLKKIGEQLSPDTRRDTVDSAIVGDTWLPERYVLEWQHAVWTGPAKQDDERFNRFLHSTIAQGFGRIRRFLLVMVTPALLLDRTAEFWRHEHTHGTLTSRVDGRSALLTLTDHPYASSFLAARVMAESLRHAASLSRTRGVTETHLLLPKSLQVRLTWT
jgi:hypothetical protein